MEDLLFWTMLLIICTMGGIIIGMNWFINSRRWNNPGPPYGGSYSLPLQGQLSTNDSSSNTLFLLVTGGILLLGFFVKSNYSPYKESNEQPTTEPAKVKTLKTKVELEREVYPIQIPVRKEERPGEALNASANGPSPGANYIHLGTFEQLNPAKAQKSAWNGFKGKIALILGPNKRGQYQVLLGPFSKAKRANQFIAEFGIPGFSVKVPFE